VRPSNDPVRSFVDNLQKMRATCIVKDNIIPAIPDRPDQSTNTNSYSCFGCFVDPIQPFSKHVLNISKGRHIKSELNNSPNSTSKLAFKKEVFYSLFLITQSIFLASALQ
jgi:hypothetical protein